MIIAFFPVVVNFQPVKFFYGLSWFCFSDKQKHYISNLPYSVFAVMLFTVQSNSGNKDISCADSLLALTEKALIVAACHHHSDPHLKNNCGGRTLKGISRNNCGKQGKCIYICNSACWRLRPNPQDHRAKLCGWSAIIDSFFVHNLRNCSLFFSINLTT